MKLILSVAIAVSASLVFTSSTLADENHDIIEKVMKNGLKAPKKPENAESQMEKLLGGTLKAEETKALLELVKTMHGTKAPVGDQAAYDEKVKELIAALEEVAGGKTDEKALERLDKAQNCKACHSDHKPKKK